MRSTITTSEFAKRSAPVSHSSIIARRANGTSRWDISSFPFTTFAHSTPCIITSPRFFASRRQRSQNCPCRSGSAPTEWLPVVTTITCPRRAAARRSRFMAMRTDACSSRLRHTPFSNMNVSSPAS